MAANEKRRFKVTVVRTSYARKDIVVEAKDADEARRLGLDQAGSHLFSEHDADYDVEHVTEEEN